MDLVISINNKDIHIDVTNIDWFVLDADLSPSYFPGAASANKS